MSEVALHVDDESIEALRTKIEDLRSRLDEAEQTISALRHGAGDATVVQEQACGGLYSFCGADGTYRPLVEQMNEARRRSPRRATFSMRIAASASCSSSPSTT